jgi:hypothetical protein
MKAILLALILSGAWCRASGQTSAQVEQAHSELERTRQAAEAVIPQFRASINSMLTPTQKQIEQQTTINIPDSWEVQARAFRDASGHRQIELNAGLAEIYDWMSTSIAAIAPTNQRCAREYVSSIFSGIMENSKSIALGVGEVPVYPPFVFAQRHPEFCQGISEQLLTGSAVARRKRQAALGASMHWTLSHELAHQLYGHVDTKYSQHMTSTELAHSRNDETQADMFAFRALQQPGFDPLLAMPAYFFIGIMDADAEHEGTSDHPSGPRRFRVLVGALEADTNDPEFKAELVNSGQLSNWQNTVQQLRALTGPDSP